MMDYVWWIMVASLAAIGYVGFKKILDISGIKLMGEKKPQGQKLRELQEELEIEETRAKISEAKHRQKQPGQQQWNPNFDGLNAIFGGLGGGQQKKKGQEKVDIPDMFKLK